MPSVWIKSALELNVLIWADEFKAAIAVVVEIQNA